MANIVTNRGKFLIATGTNLVSQADLKLMALDNQPSVYTPDADTNFVDEGGANDVLDAEYVGANYTGAFGGSGRKTLASKGWTEDDTNDRAEFDAADITWTAIGGGTETIDHVVLIDETGEAADTAAEVIAVIDSDLPVTTNGGDVTIAWNSEGIIHLT